MGHAATSALISTGLFFGILVMWEVGRRIALARRSLAKDTDAESTGIGAVEGAVFGLMGLMLAFSFSGAMSRWDVRRGQVVQEANAIGTAWLRLDLLPAASQPELRGLFRDYLDARLAAYKDLTDSEVAVERLGAANALQAKIWGAVMAATGTRETDHVRLLLLPALNEMFDITTTRTMAAKAHPPQIINALLILLVLASAMLAGGSMATNDSRAWMHVFCFALVLSLSVYMIFDLEYPRLGLIRLDAVDQVLVDLRATMN